MTAQPSPFHAIDFAAHARVAVAFSGGGDSTALLAMLHQWRTRTGKRFEIIAVTVDHGLQPDSRAAAERAGAICGALGIAHRIETWTGAKPKARIQEFARNARHDLLARAAQDFGSRLVLTGHTLDDQRETVFMRRQRGLGPGLAGIAPATLFWRHDYRDPTVWFARPLLAVQRAALRRPLTEAGIGWIDDPSNANPDFERVRVRGHIASMAPAGVAALDRMALEAAADRIGLGARAAGLIDAHCREVSPGLFRFDPSFLTHGDKDAAIHALRLVAAFAGGAGMLPDIARSARMFAMLAPDFRGRRTFCHCFIDSRKDGLFVLRENRGPRGRHDWLGGRYWIPQALDVRGPGDRTPVISAGKDHEAPFALPSPAGVPAALVRSAYLKQPVLAKDERRTLIWRTEAGQGWKRILNPWPHHLPSFDIAAAKAVARLGGLEDIPDLPLR